MCKFLASDKSNCDAPFRNLTMGKPWPRESPRMKRMRRVPNVISYSSAISACEKGGQWLQAQWKTSGSIDPLVFSHQGSIMVQAMHEIACFWCIFGSFRILQKPMFEFSYIHIIYTFLCVFWGWGGGTITEKGDETVVSPVSPVSPQLKVSFLGELAPWLLPLSM